MTAAPSTATVRRLSPVLLVDAIEPCLAFWTDRLGFARTAEVPHGDALGFVILEKDGIEIMYQTRASAAEDIPALAGAAGGPAGGPALFIEVSDVAAAERALDGADIVVPRRTTFYGMDEVGAREPGGTVVVFAQKTA